jgi:uncharacterized membrane protein
VLDAVVCRALDEMHSIYLLSVTLHLLAAFLWLGGMFFFAAVGAPVLRSIESPALRAELFTSLGERFRVIGWCCIAILVTTGIVNLHFRGLLSADLWTSAIFWGSPIGTALAWKMGAVAIMLAISGVHDFVSGPAAARHAPGTGEALSARRRAAMMARVNALVGVIVVIAAVRLARGG